MRIIIGFVNKYPNKKNDPFAPKWNGSFEADFRRDGLFLLSRFGRFATADGDGA